MNKKTKEEAMWHLSNAVNAARYRGPKRDEPMRDSYHWPMNFFEYEAIATAALALIVAVEKEEAAVEGRANG